MPIIYSIGTNPISSTTSARSIFLFAARANDTHGLA